jgi:hypothetical protein
MATRVERSIGFAVPDQADDLWEVNHLCSSGSLQFGAEVLG